MKKLIEQLSLYGEVQAIKEGSVFTLLMTGKKVDELQTFTTISNLINHYAAKMYPLVEYMKVDKELILVVMKRILQGNEDIQSHLQDAGANGAIHISLERLSQLRSRQIVDDVLNNGNDQLLKAAQSLLCYTITGDREKAKELFPDTWRVYHFDKWTSPAVADERRLIIAGALIAAHIDTKQVDY